LPFAERTLTNERHPGACVTMPRVDDAIDRGGGPACRAGASLLREAQPRHRHLERGPVLPSEVEYDVLNLERIYVRREILPNGAETDHHRRRGLLRIVEVVPLIGQLVPETERAIVAYG